jgi:hypothetical protein
MKDHFGFFKCKITTPEYLEHPIIQTHVKTSNGIRTIASLGTWTDVLFSEDIYNAMKFGYKFEIMEGYTFDSNNVFNGIITDLYQMRLKYSKSDPMNYISKIIMNSLYGRFGMQDSFKNIDILSKTQYNKLEKSNTIIHDVLELGNKYLVQYTDEQSMLDTQLDNGTETHNVNIAVASAITAYARIHMSQFKNNPNNEIS